MVRNTVTFKLENIRTMKDFKIPTFPQSSGIYAEGVGKIVRVKRDNSKETVS